MASPETSFYRNHVKAKMSGLLHIERIENSVGSGFPDISAAGLGKQFLIETKVAKVHAGEETIFFQRFQLSFYQKRLKYTDNKGIFVLLKCDDRILLYEAPAVLAAPRFGYKRWNCVLVKDCQPIGAVYKPFEKSQLQEMARLMIAKS